MGNGHALADPGGAEALALEEDADHLVRVEVGVLLGDGPAQLGEDRGLVGGLEIGEDEAAVEQLADPDATITHGRPR